MTNNYTTKTNQTSYGLASYGVNPYQNTYANSTYSNNFNSVPYTGNVEPATYYNTSNYALNKNNFTQLPSSFDNSYNGTYTSLSGPKFSDLKLGAKEEYYTSPLSSVPVTSSSYYMASTSYHNGINNKAESFMSDPLRTSPYSSPQQGTTIRKTE